MLIRFGASNHRSILDYQELSLVASSLRDNASELIPAFGGEYLLPAVAIYGANAAGKSNVLHAFEFYRGFILHSHSRHAASTGIPRQSFKLSPKSAKKPSQFDCDFILDGVRYHYAFVVDDEQVRQEWLYAFPRRQRRVLFHRDSDQNDPMYFGKSLRGENRTIERLTRPNSLFLSAAAQNNHEVLKPVYDFFTDRFEHRDSSAIDRASDLALYLEREDLRDDIIAFLKLADIGISGVRVEKKKRDEFDKKLEEFLRENITELGDEFSLPEERRTVSFSHESDFGKDVYFHLRDESHGTLALLSLLGVVFECLQEGKILMVDELESSVHPLLSRALIRLFSRRRTNRGGGQIIFTTHDTNLLSTQVLRRDQVWFAQKDRKGSTHIFPLTEIKTRKTDNLEKGYLEGRFGAIPFLGSLSGWLGEGGA